MTKPPPQIPIGTSSALRGISDNFAFHASPESFIASRVLQLQHEQPEILDRRVVLRVKILNRNVAIVSGYDQIRQILTSEATMNTDGEAETPAYVAGSAYDALMSAFFPGPNLLLADGCPHAEMRKSWDQRMESCREDKWRQRIGKVIDDYCTEDLLAGASSSQSFDLYDAMKNLSWKILFKCFLNLESDHELFQEIQELQEVLLRGQFSLLPVSLNTGFWKSPRRLGIDAREKLQQLIAKRLMEDDGGLFGQVASEQVSHIANHVLMMTSSLAVKGMASLLTAFMLNLFGFNDQGALLCDKLKTIQEKAQLRDQLRSMYLETERLSPPIVGIMRRASKENILCNAGSNADVLLPRGWDVWLYFVGGTRDKKAFGQDSDRYDPRRYLSEQTPKPLGFGQGSKTCLGRDFIRSTVLLFAEKLLSDNYHLKVDDLEPGVKGWLGWTEASPEDWASDMKQLPTQHPTRPVLVRVTK